MFDFASSPTPGAQKQEEKDDAMEMITTIKNMTGLFEDDPPDSTYDHRSFALHFSRTFYCCNAIVWFLISTCGCNYARSWLHMDRMDHNTGVRVPMGQICIR